MAKLTKTKVFTFTQDTTKGALVTVGNNRQVRTIFETDEKSGTQYRYIECFLHGHNVATFCVVAYWFAARGAWEYDDKICSVVLNDCGHRTTTTRAAMSDFLGAMGLAASVSFSGGRFAVRYMAGDCQWREDREPGGVKAFPCARPN